MSMSQAEIEALMSGAESIEPDEEETNSVAQEDTQESVDAIEDTPENEDTTEVANEEVTDSEVEEEIDNDDINDILAGIDGIVDDGEIEEVLDKSSEESAPKKEPSIEELIDANQYPMPVKHENKVVNQLNEVADDSEEKASQIFDVLSFILDENNEIQKYNKSMSEFIDTQVALLDALSKKFPNIDVFSENLTTAQSLQEVSQNLSSKVDGENNKVFEAMELMQYHDINRQKIERVMAVIRKLNSYLNGIFEDDNDKPEVQIAKHISGDSNDVVGADDIDSLIAEFSK
jgi:hypothetical protein